MAIDTTAAKKYLADCRTLLGNDWVADADKNTVDGARNIGGIAKEYALISYMNGVTVAKCVKNIKLKFPLEG